VTRLNGFESRLPLRFESRLPLRPPRLALEARGSLAPGRGIRPSCAARLRWRPLPALAAGWSDPGNYRAFE
jgi:hypothetical protein